MDKKELFNRIICSFKQNVLVEGEYKNKNSILALTCLDCGYTWETRAYNVMFRKNHECPNCGEHRNSKVAVTCARCGKTIYRSPSSIEQNKTGLFYCSRECGNIAKAEALKTESKWNYRERAFAKYPHKCAVCGWNEDERVLEVHHIDENRENGSIENLCILCPICHKKVSLYLYELTSDFKLKEK